MPLDYLYTQTKETWLQRKIQIGRRDEEFTVMLSQCGNLRLLQPLKFFREINCTLISI